MVSGLEGLHAVKAQPRGASPYHDVTVDERHATGTLGPALTSEEKHGRQPERDGHDGRFQVLLILVLMKREPRAGLVAAPENGVGHRSGEARSRPSGRRKPPEARRLRRPPSTPGRVEGGVRNPAGSGNQACSA